MKKDDLIKSILSEAEDIKIPDLNERARLEPIATLPDEVRPKEKAKKVNYLRAFTLVLILVMGFGFYYTTIMKSETKVTIDINPSIELTLNSRDTVIGITSFNEEGNEFASRLNVMHRPINDVIDDVIALAYDMNYLEKGQSNAILFSVKSLTTGKESYHESALKTAFDTAVNVRGIDTRFYYSEYTAEDEIIADKYDLSPAKIAFIRQLLEQKHGIEYSPSQLPTTYFNHSVTQLVNLFD